FGKKHRRRLQDLVRAAQLVVLLAQRLDLLALLAAQPLTATRIDLGLAHPLAQRLRVDPQISSDMRNRPAALKRQPNTAIQQLLWIPDSSWHRRSVSFPQNRTCARSDLTREKWSRH